jgi:hypothetical protein
MADLPGIERDPRWHDHCQSSGTEEGTEREAEKENKGRAESQKEGEIIGRYLQVDLYSYSNQHNDQREARPRASARDNHKHPWNDYLPGRDL